MKDFVSFGTDCQSIFIISARLLEDDIDGVCVTKFQLAYIHDKTHPLHNCFVKLCSDVHYIWWINQGLEP